MELKSVVFTEYFEEEILEECVGRFLFRRINMLSLVLNN
jgi:hypothetical protein